MSGRPSRRLDAHDATPCPSESAVTGSAFKRLSVASVALSGTALALAGVGVTMNGWFARSLGSTDLAGWFFLAVGMASRWRGVLCRDAGVCGGGRLFASVNIADV
jgi:hypothetical protein